MCLNHAKTELTFPVDVVVGTAFRFLQIVLTVLIWKGLYRYSGNTEVMGVALSDMLSYTVLAQLTSTLTGNTGIMYRLNESFLEGSIVDRLTAPLNVGKYYILDSLAAKPMELVTETIPVILTACVLFGTEVSANPWSVIAYFVAVFLAFMITTGYHFVLGLSVIWLKDAYFFEWLDEVVWMLFAGLIVPMWFFPSWLETVGRILPFRYAIFEPVSILMGKTPPEQIPMALCFAAAWAIGLYALAALIWSRGRKRLLVNGG
jgi:ABC-2 type transport system permease protein